MYVEALQRDLRICGQAECKEILEEKPGYWNVVSIREPHHNETPLPGARKVLRQVFSDVDNEEGGESPFGFSTDAPRSAHLQAILEFADSAPKEPLLIHCWAGISRSTGVALVLLLRALWKEDAEIPPLVEEAVDRLVAIRPHALPNPLVVRLGLEGFLPLDLAEVIAENVKCDRRVGREPVRLFLDMDEEDL